MLVIALLLIFGIITAAIFNLKGRNPVWGAALGIGLGLVGILIAVCLRSKK